MSREPDCAAGLVLTLIIAGALCFGVILAHPTAQERSRALDAVGATTGVNWR